MCCELDDCKISFSDGFLDIVMPDSDGTSMATMPSRLLRHVCMITYSEKRSCVRMSHAPSVGEKTDIDCKYMQTSDSLDRLRSVYIQVLPDTSKALPHLLQYVIHLMGYFYAGTSPGYKKPARLRIRNISCLRKTKRM